MTPTEADERIILSRRTLASYSRMVDAGDVPDVRTLDLIFQEVGILEHLAHAFPVKAEKLIRLAIDWAQLHDALRVRLH